MSFFWAAARDIILAAAETVAAAERPNAEDPRASRAQMVAIRENLSAFTVEDAEELLALARRSLGGVWGNLRPGSAAAAWAWGLIGRALGVAPGN